MAIAEAEPKKGEVAVTSAGVNDGIKVLNAGKNFARNEVSVLENLSTDTSEGTVKRYNLYDNIKGFRFEMPDGWNDEDIGLFVSCCLEKKEDFSKANIDRTKIWSDIAESGAKKSKNPSLFTINSCLELAERIRYYVSKNFSILQDNEPFMQFYSDVKNLLPHFSHNFVTKKVMENKDKNNLKNETMNGNKSELLSNDADLGDIIHDLTVENASAIRNGNPNVWTEISNKLKEILGINIDSKTILESEKIKIISDVKKLEVKGTNKKDAFLKRARGFIEVFNFIAPLEIKVSDYVSPSVDSTISLQNNNKHECMEEARSDNKVPSNDSKNKFINSSIEYQNDAITVEIKKGKRGRPRKIKKDSINKNQEIFIEPSSTTSFDELTHKEKLNQNERSIKEENDQFSTSMNLSNELKNCNPSKSFDKNPRRLIKQRHDIPVRVMPSRAARNKVVSYSLKNFKSFVPSAISSRPGIAVVTTADKQHSQSLRRKDNIDEENAKNTPEFRGFDSSSEDTTDDLDEKFKKLKSLRNTLSTNADTTTKHLDDKLDLNVLYLKRLNRKRKDIQKKQDLPTKQEDFVPKVRIVHADTTMKNPVVKIVDCQHKPSIDYLSHRSIFGLPKQQNKASFLGSRIRQERSEEVDEETVVLAKDVVDSEYNPSSDSAKLVSDEHLNKGQCSDLINKSVSEAMTVSSPHSRLRDSKQFSKGLDFSSAMSLNVESNLHLTKHHINPFCETSSHKMNGGPATSSTDSVFDSPDDMCIENRSLNSTTLRSKLQENSVSPYSVFDGTSSNFLDANQTPSTSSCELDQTVSHEEILESTLATLKKRKKNSSKQDGICISSSNVVPNRFLSEIQDAKLPDWFDSFVADFRKHEAWKIQQLLKMQQELADVEHRKVVLLEKILGSLVNQ